MDRDSNKVYSLREIGGQKTIQKIQSSLNKSAETSAQKNPQGCWAALGNLSVKRTSDKRRVLKVCWAHGIPIDNIKDGHEPVRIRKTKAQNAKMEQSDFHCYYCFACKL